VTLRPLAAIAALLAFVAAAPPGITQIGDDGVVRTPFRDGVPLVVKCPQGNTCDIALEKGETVNDVVCSRSRQSYGDGWIIDEGHQGATPMIYVTGDTGTIAANLIVTTSRRRYVFFLVPAVTGTSAVQTAQVRTSFGFIFNTDPTPASSASPAPTPSPLPSDTAFEVCGAAAPFAPRTVRRVGDLTYIDLADGYYPLPDVVAFELDKNVDPCKTYTSGRMVPVGHTYDPDKRTIVVLGLYPTLMLYVGQKPHQQSLLVVRTK
jgi:hypothetical protein